MDSSFKSCDEEADIRHVVMHGVATILRSTLCRYMFSENPWSTATDSENPFFFSRMRVSFTMERIDAKVGLDAEVTPT